MFLSPIFALVGGGRVRNSRSVRAVNLSQLALLKFTNVLFCDVMKSGFFETVVMIGRWSELSAVFTCQVVEARRSWLTIVRSGELLQFAVTRVWTAPLMTLKSELFNSSARFLTLLSGMSLRFDAVGLFTVGLRYVYGLCLQANDDWWTLYEYRTWNCSSISQFMLENLQKLGSASGLLQPCRLWPCKKIEAIFNLKFYEILA